MRGSPAFVSTATVSIALRPVLLRHGQHDAAVPLQKAMEVAEQLPNARWQQVIPEAGHLGWIEQQDDILTTVASSP